MNEERAVIPGSVSPHAVDLRRAREADLNDTLDASVVIRRPVTSADMADDLLAGRAAVGPRAQIEKTLAADPADLKAVTTYLTSCGLQITSQDPVSRTLYLTGTIQQFEQAFGVELSYYARSGGTPFLSYAGPIVVPASIAPLIVAVLGLNQEPLAATR